jgi:peptidoglycan/LPS O-acetylase OafA/YrhL
VNRWPSAVWFAIAVASLVATVGAGARWDVATTLAGAAGVLIGIGIVWLIARRRERRMPRARRVSWLLPSIALFYAVAAVTGLAGGGVAAAFVPLAAAVLLLATTRTRSAQLKRRSDHDRDR